jgi:hypothetical protein
MADSAAVPDFLLILQTEAWRQFANMAKQPDRSAIGFDETMADLPAVKWKALNLRKLKDENAAKFEHELERLVTFFDG